jgi:hypothetical protein
MLENTRYLTRAEAARRVSEVHGVCCAPSTLAKRATYGTGPLYRLIGGRAMYLDRDIDVWAATLISQPRRKASEETSQIGAAA